MKQHHIYIFQKYLKMWVLDGLKRYVGVRVGVTPCWKKLALLKKHKNLHAKSKHSYGRTHFLLPVTYFPTSNGYKN